MKYCKGGWKNTRETKEIQRYGITRGMGIVNGQIGDGTRGRERGEEQLGRERINAINILIPVVK